MAPTRIREKEKDMRLVICWTVHSNPLVKWFSVGAPVPAAPESSGDHTAGIPDLCPRQAGLPASHNRRKGAACAEEQYLPGLNQVTL
jgi:hypothetical protein